MLFAAVRTWGARLAATAVAGCLSVAAAEAMEFRLVKIENPSACRNGCPVVMTATGEITARSPEQFVQFLQAHATDRNARNVVFIHSPGGNVGGSVMLGLIWRRLGTTVIVAQPSGVQQNFFDWSMSTADGLTPSICVSACVYALMGARNRVVPVQSRLGVHQTHHIISEQDLGQNPYGSQKLIGSNSLTGGLTAYAKRMGIDPRPPA